MTPTDNSLAQLQEENEKQRKRIEMLEARIQEMEQSPHHVASPLPNSNDEDVGYDGPEYPIDHRPDGAQIDAETR
jgi:hypothetical protein